MPMTWMESSIALEELLDLMARCEVVSEDCQRVNLPTLVGWSHFPVEALG